MLAHVDDFINSMNFSALQKDLIKEQLFRTTN